MLTYTDIDHRKKAFVFELDNVLFPKKDYLLQVYYLFAHFLEYTETVPPANDLTGFFKTAYEHHGEAGLFERAAEAFAIDEKYKVPFDRMRLTARLPAKLLLYESMLGLMQVAHRNGKRLVVLTDGDPTMQLNKLKHMEWNGLERAVRVYFQEELRQKGYEPLSFLLADNGWQKADVLYIHAGSKPQLASAQDGDCIPAARFMDVTGSPFIGHIDNR